MISSSSSCLGFSGSGSMCQGSRRVGFLTVLRFFRPLIGLFPLSLYRVTAPRTADRELTAELQPPSIPSHARQPFPPSSSLPPARTQFARPPCLGSSTRFTTRHPQTQPTTSLRPGKIPPAGPAPCQQKPNASEGGVGGRIAGRSPRLIDRVARRVCAVLLVGGRSPPRPPRNNGRPLRRDTAVRRSSRPSSPSSFLRSFPSDQTCPNCPI